MLQLKEILDYFNNDDGVRFIPIGIISSSKSAEQSIYSILSKQHLEVSKEGITNWFDKDIRTFRLEEKAIEEIINKYEFKTRPQFYLVFQVEVEGILQEEFLISKNEFVIKLRKKVSVGLIKKQLDEKYTLTVTSFEPRYSDYFIIKIRDTNYAEMFELIKSIRKNKQEYLFDLIEYIHPDFESITQRNDREENCLLGIPPHEPEWLQVVKARAATDFIQANNLVKLIVPIVMVDQGVDINHPEFLAEEQFGKGYNAFNGRVGDIAPSFPAENHGTACTGLILSQNQQQGILGVAPHLAKVYNIKIFTKENLNEEATSSSRIRTALLSYARFSSPISMVYNFSCKLNGYNSSIQDAFNSLLADGNKLLVCAAGNKMNCAHGDQVVYPASLRDSLCVGSVAILPEGDFVASDFNCNSGQRKIDVCAPGSHIVTTSTGDKYCTFSGTSFATPLVSGLAAMIFSIYPSLRPQEVKQIILDTANKEFNSYDPQTMGAGVINCLAAIEKTQELLLAL